MSHLQIKKCSDIVRRDFHYQTVSMLKNQLKEAREVIEIYASNDSYRSKSGGHIENKNFHSFIGQDCGRVARRYLEKYQEKE